MTDTNAALEAVRNHEWTRRLPWHYIEMLAALAEEKSFRGGDLLFREDDPADSFYMIVSGTVTLQTTVDGEPVAVQMVGEGEEIGWSAVVGEGKRRFTARATGPVRVLRFSGPALRTACERNAQFGFLLMKHLLHVVAERLDTTRMQHLLPKDKALGQTAPGQTH
jgi:CRP-like cAMP-binding protein